MAVTVLSMGVVAILTVLLLTDTLSSSSGSGTGTGTGIDNAPGVAEATSLQAQQTLSTALTTVSAAATSGGYSSLSTSTLSASNPSISFVDGASTNATTVSISVVPGSGGGGAGAGGASGATGGVGGIDGAIDGGAATGNGVEGVSGAGGGSVTLADRSAGGTCWLGLEVSGRSHLVWSSNRSTQLHGPGSGLGSCGWTSFIHFDRMAGGQFSRTLMSSRSVGQIGICQLFWIPSEVVTL